MERQEEFEAAKLRAYRQARIFEPSMEGYSAAMSVYAAAFGKPDGEPTVLLPSGETKQGWELTVPHAPECPPAPDLRGAFKAGFCAHPEREYRKTWVFDAETCSARDKEAEAYNAWLASQGAGQEK